MIGAARGRPHAGAAVAGVLALAHVALARRRAAELRIVSLAAVGGWGIESLHAATGLVAYAAGDGIAGLAPAWLAALWAQFATLQRFSLAWLGRRPVLAAATGAAGGPLAFLAGEGLGAARIDRPGGLLLLSLTWSVALPLLGLLARRLDPGGGGHGRYRLPFGRS